MTPNNNDPEHRPLLSRIVDDFFQYEDQAVRDPAELAALGPAQERPIWSRKIDQFTQIECEAVTDPEVLRTLRRAPDPPQPPPVPPVTDAGSNPDAAESQPTN